MQWNYAHFFLRDDMLARYLLSSRVRLSVCPSVRLSQAGVALKRLDELSSVLALRLPASTSHTVSDSASISQQFRGPTTAPKRRGTSEIPHPHAAHMPYLPEPRQSL